MGGAAPAADVAAPAAHGDPAAEAGSGRGAYWEGTLVCQARQRLFRYHCTRVCVPRAPPCCFLHWRHPQGDRVVRGGRRGPRRRPRCRWPRCRPRCRRGGVREGCMLGGITSVSTRVQLPLHFVSTPVLLPLHSRVFSRAPSVLFCTASSARAGPAAAEAGSWRGVCGGHWATSHTLTPLTRTRASALVDITTTLARARWPCQATTLIWTRFTWPPRPKKLGLNSDCNR